RGAVRPGCAGPFAGRGGGAGRQVRRAGGGQARLARRAAQERHRGGPARRGGGRGRPPGGGGRWWGGAGAARGPAAGGGRGGLALRVGVTRDPHWGLAIGVGLGGIFAEAVADIAVRLLPVTACDIEEMLAELRGSAVLGGTRGEPAVDPGALVGAIAG